MNENKNFYLIDTLTSDHYRKVHLPNSASACVFEVSFIEQVMTITENKDALIVLYGSSARTMDAFTAAEKLAQEGYRQINVLQGGIEAWRSRRHTTTDYVIQLARGDNSVGGALADPHIVPVRGTDITPDNAVDMNAAGPDAEIGHGGTVDFQQRRVVAFGVRAG